MEENLTAFLVYCLKGAVEVKELICFILPATFILAFFQDTFRYVSGHDSVTQTLQRKTGLTGLRH